MSEGHPINQLEQVAALLRQRLGGRVRELRVLARDGGVILQGRARCYYAKQLAKHAVMRGLRLALVANEIVVHWAPGVQDRGGADSDLQAATERRPFLTYVRTDNASFTAEAKK